MKGSIARIALVVIDDDAFTRRLVSGACKYATPQNGFITREFTVPEDATELPETLVAWAPQAVVCHLAGENEQLFELLSAGVGGSTSRPLVNVGRCRIVPGRGAVLGNAEEVFASVHEHFRERGLPNAAQFLLGIHSEGTGPRERYQEYTAARGLSFASFTLEKDPRHIYHPERMRVVEEPVATWLLSLPKPVGIFTQSHYAGGYLCRCCELLGISVPEEAAIIGCDGFDVALASAPALTTLRLPADEIGFEAAKLVAAMLAGQPSPQDYLLVPGVRLIKRASTGGNVNPGCDIDSALKFIKAHACEGIKVNDVVSHTQGVSRVAFHGNFVKITAMTPAEALRERRMSEARRLLAETKLSIGAVAGMCGYNDDIYFTKTFRKLEGVAPSVYRKMLSASFTKLHGLSSSG